MLTIESDPDRRGGYLMHDSVVVHRPMDEVFAFFSNAFNLQKMTPADMGFKVLTPRPIEMRVGLLIDYRIWTMGLPMRWQSEITVWEPGARFVDVQRKGPFRYWEHEHRFESVLEGGAEIGVRVSDMVRYGVPGGSLIHRLMVRRINERVFAHRVRVMEQVFGKVAAA